MLFLHRCYNFSWEFKLTKAETVANCEQQFIACVFVDITCSIAIYVGSISGHSCVTHSYSIAENKARESPLCKKSGTDESEPLTFYQ